MPWAAAAARLLGRPRQTAFKSSRPRLFGLVLPVDLGGFPRQWVQGIMIPAVAVSLFLLVQFWVFQVSGEAR
jgi:hypothetical protein